MSNKPNSGVSGPVQRLARPFEDLPEHDADWRVTGLDTAAETSLPARIADDEPGLAAERAGHSSAGTYDTPDSEGGTERFLLDRHASHFGGHIRVETDGSRRGTSVIELERTDGEGSDGE